MTEPRRPGRPSVGEVTIKATVPADLLAAIDASAAAADESRAAWIRRTLTKAAAEDSSAIYEQVTELQATAYREAGRATTAADREGFWPPAPDNSLSLWGVARTATGVDLNDPDADWAVDVTPGDLVRVFAAGDVVTEATILGAWAWADALATSVEDD